MRTICLSLGLLFASILEGCHGHHHDTGHLVPVAPIPPTGSQPSPAPVESNPAVIEAGPALTPETIPSPTSEVTSIKRSPQELLLELVDAYFDLDQHDLREDARAALRADASLVRTIAAQSPDTKMLIEGHCDERGSAEYNLALGAMRAEAAKEFLVEEGIPNAVLTTITYGKERPQCTTATEACWQKNRRAHLTSEQ
jgi:peptidoglycan-associated lipoprotein